MNKKSSFRLQPFLILAAVCIFLCFGLDMTVKESLRQWNYFWLLMSALLILAAYYKKLPKNEMIYIMCTGIFLRLIYILYTAVYTRQHDVVDFGTGEGHAGYIEYLFEHKALPDFDPRSVWAFFQPPLHHFISVIMMKVSIFCGTTYRQAQENIQVLTFFYMCTLLLACYFICKETGLKKTGMGLAMMLVSFHPIFILFSGSINNDALSLMLSVFALYFVILWYKKPGFLTIILLGLSIGLSMMAKLSGGIVAPAVACLFIMKTWSVYRESKIQKSWKSMGNLIVQFAAFAIVTFPTGLWWSVRNMLKFSMPLNYIPPVGEQLEHSSFFSRVFDVRMHSVYAAMKNSGDVYDEYNTILALIKTSLFGEYNYGLEWKLITPFATILFASALILIVYGLAATITQTVSKKSTLLTEWRVLFAVLYVSLLVSYFSFSLGYNNFSAQDFRYIALSIVVEAILIGLFADDLKENAARPKWILQLLKITMAVFCASSFLVYVLLGFARA